MLILYHNEPHASITLGGHLHHNRCINVKNICILDNFMNIYIYIYIYPIDCNLHCVYSLTCCRSTVVDHLLACQTDQDF